ncbi:type II secretion system protein GspL [Sphingomonas endophytica]|uniref:General secretion pathway protein GspL n=1 Tax=Sphingomonas endophytica TaxID=869719 RepID=A0A147I589_9SPHN|nr:type II secretion system protein GspL [Sphingomonas endophytica]KTT73629.1 general secretion pathway protein GspL [Sphingomonas endophytica]
MTAATLLFLPTDDSQPWRWWRIRDDAFEREGEGLPDLTDADRVVAVAPADAVTLHWAALPARSAAQAVAAARVVVSDATAEPAHDLHVAVGQERDGERVIAVVAPARMAGWLAALAQRGIDPAALVPAPLLLPEPEEGYWRGDLPGQKVVRGRTTGWADEPVLTDLVTRGEAPRALDADALRTAAVAAIAEPALDLRQGAFARRRRRAAIDWGLMRRLAVLAGLILLATLAIDVVRIMRYSFGADAIEQRAATIARQGLPRGTGDGDATRMLAERVAQLRGPGQGFTRTAAAVYAIVEAVPETEVTALQFEPNGALRVSLSLAGEAQANTVKSRLAAAGFAVESSVFQQSAGRLTGDMTVRP